MENKPLVSVVLPTYNGSKWLSGSIESILTQTYKNLELIIVDDASTDSSEEIIRKYCRKDPRVKSIRHKINKKIPQSLNDGFAVAKGDFFTWTSDDNWYEATAIEEMVNILYSSEYDMVTAEFNIYNNDEFIEVIKTDCSVDSLSNRNSIGACFLYTQKIAEKVGEYDSNKFLVEDYDYWLRILINGKIAHLNKTLYNYRLHSCSLTSTKQNDIKYAEIFLKHEFYPILKRKFQNNDFSQMAHYIGYIEALSEFSYRLNKENIRKDSIYCSGFICYFLLKFLSKNNINVNHIFDSSAEIISSQRYGYIVEDLFSIYLSSNETILIASDKFAQEIKHRINEYSVKNNVKLSVLVPISK